ncbi:MAG: hypothetical protein ACJ70V_02430 [Nitrososphaera sp.]
MEQYILSIDRCRPLELKLKVYSGTLLINKLIAVKESDSDVDTGIDIEPGDDLAFQASGEIWAGVIRTGNNGSNGWDNIDHDKKFPLHVGSNAHPYCLLGKFNQDGNYFFIGALKNRSASSHSQVRRLFLRINDNKPGNGRGEFLCRVRVWR